MMAGLLDAFNSDDGMQGLGLLAAAAPSMAPMNLAGRLAQAGASYRGMQDNKLKEEFIRSQIAENVSQNAQRAAAIGLLQRKQTALPGLFGGQPTGGMVPPESGGAPQSIGADQFDYRKALQAGYTPDEITKLAALTSLGRPEVARTIKGIGANGVEQEVQYDKFGSAVGKGVDQYRDPNKPFERDATGGIVANKPFQAYEISKAGAGAARTSNTISIAGPENKYNSSIGEGLAKEGLALVEAAKNAPAAVDNARMIRNAIDNGAITGTGAPTRLALQKTFETAGLIGPGKAASTEELMAGLGKLTLSGVKTSGLGAGNGFTDKDREFLNAAISGTIEGTPANLRRVADLSERVATTTHQKGKVVLERWQKDPALRAVAQDTVLDDIAPVATARPALSPSAPKAPVPMKGMVRGGFKFQGGNPADQANWVKQ